MADISRMDAATMKLQLAAGPQDDVAVGDGLEI